MRNCVLVWFLVLGVLGCSRDFTSSALGVRYKPPSAMKLESEEVAGASVVARFKQGLELRSVKAAPPALDAGPEAVLGAAGLAVPGRLVADSRGTLPAGPVSRYEFADGGKRTLVYFLPRAGSFLLVTFTAPERDYGSLSSRVELSLSTLELL
ncbi:hypothetical protein [Pyxidicoccus xibeiensis]|uniref:hypothetical protein n=1 Tax=Pyxidicoccus xibeiensis TaxID=2906759 RepID=UPI0020A7A908|nr:hypothetical protein [Pyxidicoccus xibeiensis]MCP3138792.1 hypothetical protein [Pyxidicoccus xibeiensis]